MAELTVQRPSVGGTAATMGAASSGGDYFQNDGKVIIRVTNGHATLARTVTADAPNTCDHGLSANAAHDAVKSVAALTTVRMGPFDPKRFNDSNGRVQLTYSTEADLTIAAERID